MCHLYPRSQTRLFSTASSWAPGLFQNAYVMDCDLGPFFFVDRKLPNQINISSSSIQGNIITKTPHETDEK